MGPTFKGQAVKNLLVGRCVISQKSEDLRRSFAKYLSDIAAFTRSRDNMYKQNNGYF
jgi:hypothetical protein